MSGLASGWCAGRWKRIGAGQAKGEHVGGFFKQKTAYEILRSDWS
eukprot:COSAG01_NODE_65246_length_274_cov_0.405714_1_plen_44_part_10